MLHDARAARSGYAEVLQFVVNGGIGLCASICGMKNARARARTDRSRRVLDRRRRGKKLGSAGVEALAHGGGESVREPRKGECRSLCFLCPSPDAA